MVPPRHCGHSRRLSSPKHGMDSLPRYALSGGLAARLWVKPPLGVVADSKERRKGTAKICLKNLPLYG
jgi:hypothetical protein